MFRAHCARLSCVGEQVVYRTILVPLDGSEVAASILEQVAVLAREYGARLLLLTVGLPIPSEWTNASDLRLTLTFQAEAYLQQVRTYLETQGLEVSTIVCIGDPACEILDVAAHYQVDLIIINSRGGGGASSLFMGSVAEKIAAAAAVPVLIFHAPSNEEKHP